MEIKTKFNIGDKCFYMKNNKVIEDEIIKIDTETLTNWYWVDETKIYVSTKEERENIKYERYVFKTKEELLASL